MNLLYCDESCHLPNDGINDMILGTIYCDSEHKRNIFNEIRKIKEKHNLSPYFEFKWTKVSPSQIEFYKEVIEYFFNNKNLNFRGIVATGKDKLDHEAYNDDDYNKWYYKMYFLLFDKIIYPDNSYKIFIDIKDTIGGKRIKVLHDVLCNNKFDFKREVIKEVNQIRSHESEIMQLTDLIIGAMSYFHRGLYQKNRKSAKSALVDLIQKKRGMNFSYNSPKVEVKFNMFIWRPRGTM